MEGAGESTLRAKYLDWCSARLAERFLDLSPEEIYALARPEEAGEGESPSASEASTGAESESGRPASPEDSTVPPAAPVGASPGPPDAPASPPSQGLMAAEGLPRPTDDGYRVLVQRVTESLLKRTSLPTFEQWSEAHAEDPERFDAELLGFWKDVVGGEEG